jgi:hypothetical protein
MIKGTYITASEKTTILNDSKASAEQKATASASKVISDDAFAVIEYLDQIRVALQNG